MIIYTDIVKRYGDITALDHINLEINEGKITALLGPNGSGKTTLFKITMGLLKPDNGEVYVNGLNPIKQPIEVRKITGYSPEEISLFESLTPLETYKFLADIYEIKENDFKTRLQLYIKLFNINEEINKLCGELSHGNRRKISIISALLHDPDILILDEPFTGLDPEAAKILKEIMKKHASKNKIVIFSTHILEIAEAVADHIIIINKGKIVAQGTKEELTTIAKKSDLESIFLELTGLSKELNELIEILWRV